MSTPMNILIDTVRVAGFRGIKNLEITLPRVTVMIGPNNSGKTTLLKAMQLALGDYSRFMCEEDIHIETEVKSEKVILVDLRIVPVNDQGDRTSAFSEDWAAEFGDKIKAEADGHQFVALRTRCMPNAIKGGFDTNRSTLERWPDYAMWTTEKVQETRLTTRLDSLPFIAIEAQRDIHQELHERTSFIGRILSGISYDSSEVKALEDLIKELNDQAVGKSEDLKSLKEHLEHLNRSFQGAGNAEITPFPKKIRDLSKNFSIHFGETSDSSFSMEYHGMGTRSWASLLTVKAFIDLLTAKHEQEVKPCFPILAVEEPEAHLHPNAQKTLYRQLADSKGQVIISTHSPYLAAMADVMDIRSLVRTATGIKNHRFSYSVSQGEKNILSREILSKRGEALFAKALLLCEGVTEEQVLPAMFEIYFKEPFHELGISCVSVGGKNYSPFIKLACSFGIPVCVISDNDGTTKNEVEAQLRRLKKATGLTLGTDSFAITYLDKAHDFEAELLSLGLRDEVIQSLVICATKGTDNLRYRAAKEKEFNALTDDRILAEMRDTKASYAGHLAGVLRGNPNNKTLDKLVPPAVAKAFGKLKGWLPQ